MIFGLNLLLVVSLADRNFGSSLYTSVGLAAKPSSQASGVMPCAGCQSLTLPITQSPSNQHGERRNLACDPFPDNLLQGGYDKAPGNVQISYSAFRDIFTSRHRRKERTHYGLHLLCLKSNLPVLSKSLSR